MDILYESDNYLIVNKPYDMYVNSDDPSETNTVAAHLGKHDCHKSGSSHQIHFVHRLDYATSGVLCLAKNRKSASKAGRILEQRLAKKYYLAVVRGHFTDSCDISYHVGEDPTTANSSHKMIAVTNEASKATATNIRPAHTRLLPLETGCYDGDDVTVVLLQPTTGRRHQLRVHCAAIGHTILGDYTYSEPPDSHPHRMFLHAARLIMSIGDEPIDVQTETPFANDDTFLEKYKTIQVLHRHTLEEEFSDACSLIDNAQSQSVVIMYGLAS